ncbi:MAG TPA: hypothetical protein VFI15_05110, partial [Candidatus Limnocylindrales bacterium]|nr:hypothetical protein [Candidatus Limnocylindrales bacterium]
MVSPKRVVRTARSSGSAPPPPRRRTTELVAGAIALLTVGGLIGAGIIGLASGPAPAATFEALALPTDDLGALPSDDASPEDSIAPVSPILEAHMPTSVQGSTMTVQSAVDATSLSSGPDGRALNAAMVHLGKDPSELELAYAADESGAIDLTILGFRADGITAAQMREAVLETWLASGTP